MYKIHEIKYSTNLVSIQVYKIEKRKRVIVRHIGTARSQAEKLELLSLARDFTKKVSKQLSLFEDNPSANILYLGYSGAS